MTHDYEHLLDETFKRMLPLTEQIEQAESELLKLKQLASATGNMVSDEAWERISEKHLKLFVKLQSRETSLTESIRSALQSIYPKWQKVGDVKALLLESGFDFGSYSSNPLSSISTALRRLSAAGEIEFHKFQHIDAFRANESTSVYLLRRGREIIGGAQS